MKEGVKNLDRKVKGSYCGGLVKGADDRVGEEGKEGREVGKGSH